MTGLERIKEQYGLTDRAVLFSPYGSNMYGTSSDKSDDDMICVIPDDAGIVTGTECRKDRLNVQFYTRSDLQDQLNSHKVVPLECYLHPCEEKLKEQFKWRLDKAKLRQEWAAKASNSFVKAKKKIEVERDYYVGWKSLFHSLRILDFAIQIAATGGIADYGSANQHWFDILNAQQYNWAYFKERYQPEYNRLASELRRVAPLEA